MIQSWSQAFDTLASLSQSWGGRIALAAAGLLVAWTAVEAVVLSGESIYDDYLAYNKPLALEVTEAGERFRVQIASTNREVKRRISYKIIDPAGTRLIDTHDNFIRATRVFYFTAETPGTHHLIIDEYDSPGGQTGVPASKYLNSKWVHVYRDDGTRMLGILGHVIAW